MNSQQGHESRCPTRRARQHECWTTKFDCKQIFLLRRYITKQHTLPKSTGSCLLQFVNCVFIFTCTCIHWGCWAKFGQGECLSILSFISDVLADYLISEESGRTRIISTNQGSFSSLFSLIWLCLALMIQSNLPARKRVRPRSTDTIIVHCQDFRPAASKPASRVSPSRINTARPWKRQSWVNLENTSNICHSTI